jgi:hypothetical protein
MSQNGLDKNQKNLLLKVTAKRRELRNFFEDADHLQKLKEILPRGHTCPENAAEAAKRLQEVAQKTLNNAIKNPDDVMFFFEELLFEFKDSRFPLVDETYLQRIGRWSLFRRK